jgi:predicted MFS family arabinose efflux permease
MRDSLPHFPRPAPPRGSPSRAELPAPLGFAVGAYVIGLGFFASVVPSPLYQDYMDLWGFSPVTLTLIYATYALGVLAALLLAGRVSDDVGRRPVLLTALAALALATVFFVFAASPWWLFVGRGLQGVATGAAISSASAAILDLQPRRDPVTSAVTNGVVSNVGLGLGILTTAVLSEVVAEPLTIPYLILLGLILVALLGVYWMPEPVTSRRPLQLALERPQVSAVVRGPFLLAGLGVLASWSIAGLFFSLGPQLGTQLFDTRSAIVASIGICALLGTAALAQLVLGRIPPWLGASAGSGILAVGMVSIVWASVVESGTVYLAGSVVSGFGFGISYLGGLRGLVAVIPPAHRAGVMSAFYLVAYVSLSVPAVLAGLLVSSLGLQTTFETFALIAAGLALVVAVGGWRTRLATRAPAS